MMPQIHVGLSVIDVSSVRDMAALRYTYYLQRRDFFRRTSLGNFARATEFSGAILNTRKFPVLKRRRAALGTVSLLVSALPSLRSSTATNTACSSSLAMENAVKEASGKPPFAQRNTNSLI